MFLFDQTVRMRLLVSLIFICVLLPAGKNNKKKIQKLFIFVGLCDYFAYVLCAVCGLKCFTCWDVNPGTCHQVWDCPAHFDRCSYTIGKLPATCGCVHHNPEFTNLCHCVKHKKTCVHLLIHFEI